MSDELKHWGIKGMKWGVRRYQNKDGSLTELGKKRMRNETFELSDDKLKRYKPNPKKWVDSDLKNVRNLTNDARKLADNTAQISRKTRENPKKIKMDLSNMTEKEMRDRINRELLERQYNDMFAPKTVNKGRERIEKILEYGGLAMGLTGSALSIAIGIRQLM